MATKDIKRLEDCIRLLDTRAEEFDRCNLRMDERVSSALAGVSELRRTTAEGKAWLQGNIDINTGAISDLNQMVSLQSNRITSLEGEVKRLKSTRFSFRTYLSRLFNALRNKP